MILRDDSDVANTRAQIDWVEKRIATLEAQTEGNSRARELTLWSLSRLLTQLKEDIARYEAAHVSKI